MAEPLKVADNILIFAGEASGDAYGALLIKELRAINNNLNIYGGGGSNMLKAGLNPIYTIDNLSVMGLVEVISIIPSLLKIKKSIIAFAKNNQPKVAIFIDYPGFHVPLAKKLKQLNIPILYYISPKIWAYREKRITKIISSINQLASIFDFEKAIYTRYGFDNCHFVGHPIVDVLKTSGALATKPHTNLIGILPGSRNSEIAKLLPTMIEACKLLKQENPQLKFWLSCVNNFNNQYYKNLIGEFKIDFIKQDLHLNIAKSFAIIGASGTVNLEMAYLGIPSVITYKLAPLTHSIAKRIIKIPHASPVNIIMQEELYPELLQNLCNPQNIYKTVKELIYNTQVRNTQLRKLHIFKKQLGLAGASERVAKMAINLMAK